MIWRVGMTDGVFLEVDDDHDDRPTPEYEVLPVEDTWGGETIDDGA